MVIDSLATFLDVLRQTHVLEPAQLDELRQQQTSLPAEPRTLARDLVRRGWLTPYQVNQIFQGKGLELLLGSYVLLERLGEGGMGQVFQARNWKLGRIVALKLIRKERLTAPDATKRFQREIRAAAQLEHVHIVRAFDADEVKGTHFFVMEYVDGIDLAKLVKQHGPVPLDQACEYIRQAALGLQHAFERGLVHRDIKPHNLLRTKDGSTIKILDMGLARLTQSEAENEASSTMTLEGVVMGTPDYLAPEQTLDAHSVDIRADIYSLGCTLYFLLTGQPPFPGGSVAEKLVKHQLREPQPVEQLRPEVPPDLAVVVRQMMAKRREERYQTPDEVAETMGRLVGLLSSGTHSGGSQATANIQPAAQPPTVSFTRWLKGKARADEQAQLPEGTLVLRESLKAWYHGADEGRQRWRIALLVAAPSLLLGLLLVLLVPLFLSRPEPVASRPADPVELPVQPRVKQIFVDPVDNAWIKEVQALPAEQQVEVVVKKLRELNPGFDGKAEHKIADGKVTELAFCTDAVSDISPVQALRGLKKLACDGSQWDKGQLFDLTPLRGLALTYLSCHSNQGITDLSPLREMPLATLNFSYAKVTDLKCLQGMKLTDLEFWGMPLADLEQIRGLPLMKLIISGSKVTDLSPLQGMSLQFLAIGPSGITDLSPLRNMPLTTLWIDRCHIHDLSPLQGMALTGFICRNTPVRDLAVLKNMPLETLECDYNRWRGDGEVLRPLKTLEKINGKPAAEFWKQVDAEEAAFDTWVAEVQKLPPEKQVEAVAAELKKRNPGFDGKLQHKIEDGIMTEISLLADEVTDLAPLRALRGLRSLQCRTTSGRRAKLADLWPLKGLPLANLHFLGTGVSDLSPLRGMKLEHLEGSFTPVADLTPLRGMPLTHLYVNSTAVQDLSPLRGMPLVCVGCDGTPVEDLEPLRGMKLVHLAFPSRSEDNVAVLAGMPLNKLICHLRGCDLGILRDAPLQTLSCDFNLWRDAEVLCAFKTLERINGQAAAEFWKPYDEFEAWCKSVAQLPPEQQVEAVVAELKKRNPGFDGQVQHKIAGGKVTELKFCTDGVTDISPVRALHGLRKLDCSGSMTRKGKLADLWPLHGMQLQSLSCSYTTVADLTPIKGMRLDNLSCGHTPIADLSPLKGMPLARIWCVNTGITDLEPLAGMPLEHLVCAANGISDLTPLRGMPLTSLHLDATAVTDLSPLRGMSLKFCQISSTRVADLSPLAGMPLQHFNCNASKVSDLSPLKDTPLEILGANIINIWRDGPILRGITTLKEINGKPAAEFWKPYDEFEAWCKEVAQLPPEKQVEVVAAELKKRNPGFDGKVEYKIETNAVTHLTFCANEVTDLSPVRALSVLQQLWCSSGPPLYNGKLQDLWPLQGMSLSHLACAGTQVSDLSPLRGMSLVSLQIYNTKVSDLSPLRGMPLGHLNFHTTPVSSLAPLQGLPLTVLDCNRTQISELAPLRGLLLEFLGCQKTKVTDLSPLKELPKLKLLYCDFEPARDAAILRAIPTLETINGQPAAEFWKAVEARQQP